jgi:thiosulfate/3-mercaptopyruvate sulfurtransferase
MLPLFIEPNDLQKCCYSVPSDLIIIDLGSEARFSEEHIPGAILVTPADTQAPAPVPGLLPSQEALTHLMRRIGLTKNSHVVVYDDEGGGWAGRFIWILDEIGHANYSYLNGGLISWKGEGLAIETKILANKPSDISIEVNHAHTIQYQALCDVLSSPNTLIWDARSPLEYLGEKKFSTRGGHIPGAINYEWTRAMDKNNYYRLKPLPKLESELAEIGISRDKDIFTHCQSHHRSGLTYLIAKLLNFPNIKAYAGSWGEWGNRQDTPIES